MVMWECHMNGGRGLWRSSWLEGLMRPSKVIANAFSAAFHLMTQRALPRPVGSSDRVTR